MLILVLIMAAVLPSTCGFHRYRKHGKSHHTSFVEHHSMIPEEEDNSNDPYSYPELKGPYFEGDIEGITEAPTSPPRKWEKGRDGMTVVFYQFRWVSPDLHKKFEAAINHIAQRTCIRFDSRTNEPNYINVVESGHGICSSFVGMKGGPQEMRVGTGCQGFGTIVHLLVHAIGFYHQHQRPDRDGYITIKWGSIPYDKLPAFTSYGNGPINTNAVQYDYSSIMHFPGAAFSVDGSNTIYTKFVNVEEIGRRDGLSKGDAKAINQMYCPNVSSFKIYGWSTYPPSIDHLMTARSDGSVYLTPEVNNEAESQIWNLDFTDPNNVVIGNWKLDGNSEVRYFALDNMYPYVLLKNASRSVGLRRFRLATKDNAVTRIIIQNHCLVHFNLNTETEAATKKILSYAATCDNHSDEYIGFLLIPEDEDMKY